MRQSVYSDAVGTPGLETCGAGGYVSKYRARNNSTQDLKHIRYIYSLPGGGGGYGGGPKAVPLPFFVGFRLPVT